MPGYLEPIVESGNSGYKKFQFTQTSVPNSFKTSIPINAALDLMKTWLGHHGWSLVTGVDADATLTTLALPFRPVGVTDGGGSFVTGTAGGAFIGTFDGTTFQMWDAFSDVDTDPTGTVDSEGNPIVGVRLGRDRDSTAANFCAKATVATAYTWAVSGDDILGNPIITAIAKNPGGVGNDPQWSPNGTHCAGARPSRGGWVMRSTPEPFTSDQLEIYFYENQPLGHFRVNAKINGNAAGTFYQLDLGTYHGCSNPYGLAFLIVTGLNVDQTNVNRSMLLSCMYIPSEFQAGRSHAAFMIGAGVLDIHTSSNAANISAVVDGTFIDGSMLGRSGAIRIGLAGIQIDTDTLNETPHSAVTNAGKPLLMAPMVMIAVADDKEARIAGVIYDAFVLMTPQTLGNQDFTPIYSGSPTEGELYTAIGENQDSLRLFESSLWIRSVETP